MIINYKNYVNNPKHPGNQKEKLKEYQEEESDKKVKFIQKEYIHVK